MVHTSGLLPACYPYVTPTSSPEAVSQIKWRNVVCIGLKTNELDMSRSAEFPVIMRIPRRYLSCFAVANLGLGEVDAGPVGAAEKGQQATFGPLDKNERCSLVMKCGLHT